VFISTKTFIYSSSLLTTMTRYILSEKDCNEDQVLTEEMGCEIGAIIRLLKGTNFHCSCGKDFEIKEILGYAPHSAGYMDRNNQKWWVFIHCPHCHYEWALWKIAQRIQNETLEKLQTLVARKIP